MNSKVSQIKKKRFNRCHSTFCAAMQNTAAGNLWWTGVYWFTFVALWSPRSEGLITVLSHRRRLKEKAKG